MSFCCCWTFLPLMVNVQNRQILNINKDAKSNNKSIFSLPTLSDYSQLHDYIFKNYYISFVNMELIWEDSEQNLKSQDYSINDLARALIREYLIQKGMNKTFKIFEAEDIENKKKISKNKLIKMISMKNLLYLNKHSSDPQNTILEILVGYLKKKYEQKTAFIQTTGEMSEALNIKEKRIPTVKEREKPKIDENKNKSRQQLLSKETKQIKSGSRPQTAKVQIKNSENSNIKDKQLKTNQKQTEIQKQSLKLLYKKIGDGEKLKKQPQKSTNQPIKNEQLHSINHNKVNQITKIKQKNQNDYKDEFQQFEQEKKLKTENKSEKKSEKMIQLQKQYPIQMKDVKSVDQEQRLSKTKRQNNMVEQQKHIFNKKPELEKNNEQIITPSDKKSLPQKPIIQQPEKMITRKQDEKLIKEQKKEIKDQNISRTKQQNQIKDNLLNAKSSKKQIINKLNEQVNLQKQINSENKNEEQLIPQRNKMRMVRPKNNLAVEQKLFIIPKVQQKQQKIAEQLPNVLIKHDLQEKKPVMKVLNKKIKKNEDQIISNQYPTKFKFDQNFEDKPLGNHFPKYDYAQFKITKFIIDQEIIKSAKNIIFESKLNYSQRMAFNNLSKKKNQRGITSKEAEQLKKIVFQSGPSILPKAWSQGFILSPHPLTPYGIKQIEGGPCGIIAAAQCFYLKHLLFCCQYQKESNLQTTRQICLVAAVTNMLWKVKTGDKIYLAIPNSGASKVDINYLRIITIQAIDFVAAFEGIWSYKDYLIGLSNHGVTVLMYSIVFTKGCETIEQEIDCKGNPLIGNHGHCTQQLVNLFITGVASSNCFDGQKILDDNYKLKGIPEKSQFGFLTVFETLKYIEVGKNLKNPIFPIWIICKQFHYHVIFSEHYLSSQNNKIQKFDVIYFDGLYNCQDRIRLTISMTDQTQETKKDKNQPLIQQVLETKWGKRLFDWNGSIKIL